MAKKKERPTIERLQQLFHVDFEHGTLTWKITPNNQIEPGTPAGFLDPSCEYYRVAVDGRRYMVHQIIWAMKTGKWPELHINHKSHDTTDNSFNNLREATKSQAKQSSRLYRNNKFGLKGVSRYKDRFRSDIRVDGKTIYLGIHDTPLDAHAAYVNASRKYFGSFARAA